MGNIAMELQLLAKSPKKTMIIDIETSPSMAFVWSLFNENVGIHKLIESGRVISFAAKWLGDDKTVFYSDYHNGHTEMVDAAFKLVDEADVIIHYNGRAFDMKHLNTEFLLCGHGVPSPYKEVDLLQVVRQKFKFISNKLDYVSRALGVGQKVEHSGFEMWRDCLMGTDSEKAEAWKMMKKYNIGDVSITERVYNVLYPWIDKHPTTGVLMDTDVPTCYKCGSQELTPKGNYTNNTYIYDQYLCGGCGTWLRGNKSVGKASNTK